MELTELYIEKGYIYDEFLEKIKKVYSKYCDKKKCLTR